MYYTMSSKELPGYITKLPEATKAKWIMIFNKVEEQEDSKIATVVANQWLQKRIKKSTIEGKTNNTYVIERITLDVSGDQFIKRTADGEEYVDFVLTDVGFDDEGVKYPEPLIQKWVSQVNAGSNFVGDIDHKEYDDILSKAINVEHAAELIKNTKKGIAKTVKAFFDKGKMWVRAVIDKRYKKMIEKAKGVSLEAIVSRDANGAIIDGDLLGFTFAVNQRPVNPRAVIA